MKQFLFAAGREVKVNELAACLELTGEDTVAIVESLREDFKNRGTEIIRIEDGYQMVTKKEFYEYLYQIFDKRNKPNLSPAALETLAIIAYNPKVTRAEIEQIRGVNSDGTIYKLLEYNLIEEAGRLDAPGRPTTYRTTNEFLKMFGLTSLDELPELPRYKIDENEQIVIDDLLEESKEEKQEDPTPAREEKEEKS